MHRFSNDEIHKFLDLLKSFECLWNKKHKKYKNEDVKKLALKEMEIQMNIPKFTFKDIKTKIRNMKTTYQREVKRNSLKKPFWFDHADSFLRPHWSTAKVWLDSPASEQGQPQPRGYRTTTTAKYPVIKEEYEMDIEDNVIVKQEVEEYNHNNSEINFESVFVKEEVDVYAEDNEQHNEAFEQQNGDVEERLLDEDVSRTSNCLIDTCNETNRNIIDTSNENIEATFIKPAPVRNKLDKFGRIMIDYLREMPPKRQLRCRAEIESIMLRFQTENLMNTEDF